MNEGKPHGKMEQKESKKVISVENQDRSSSKRNQGRQETKEDTRETKRRPEEQVAEFGSSIMQEKKERKREQVWSIFIHPSMKEAKCQKSTKDVNEKGGGTSRKGRKREREREREMRLHQDISGSSFPTKSLKKKKIPKISNFLQKKRKMEKEMEETRRRQQQQQQQEQG